MTNPIELQSSQDVLILDVNSFWNYGDFDTLDEDEYVILDIDIQTLQPLDVTYSFSAFEGQYPQLEWSNAELMAYYQYLCACAAHGGFDFGSGFANGFMPETSQFTTMGGGILDSGHDHEHCKSCESKGGHGKIVNGRCQSCKQIQF